MTERTDDSPQCNVETRPQRPPLPLGTLKLPRIWQVLEHPHIPASKVCFNFVRGLVNNLRSSTLMVYSCLEHLMDRGACPWKSPGKNTGMGGHSLLQGIFPTQEWNPGLLHWQADSLPLCNLGRPLKILAPYIL